MTYPSEFVAKEAQDIEQRPWPRHPLLPLKNLTKRDDQGSPLFGTLLKIDGHIVPHVVLAGITDLMDNPTIKPAIKPYASLKEMVEDGWVVD